MQTSSRFAVAVHILSLMAGADDEPIKSDQMAGSVNTNPVVIRRILCSLSRAELVTSQSAALAKDNCSYYSYRCDFVNGRA